MATRTAKKTAKKKTARKKVAKPAAKRATSRKAAPVDGDEVKVDIVDDTLRYKLKATHLEWSQVEERIRAEAAADYEKLLARKRRNSDAWKRLNKSRIDACNEIIDAMTPGLPDGYAIKHLDALEGFVRAEHDPAARGEHIPAG
ncbi:MAG TPA: hypothetical protein VIY27_08320 [Myxococcota bacterium]